MNLKNIPCSLLFSFLIQEGRVGFGFGFESIQSRPSWWRRQGSTRRLATLNLQGRTTKYSYLVLILLSPVLLLVQSRTPAYEMVPAIFMVDQDRKENFMGTGERKGVPWPPDPVVASYQQRARIPALTSA